MLLVLLCGANFKLDVQLDVFLEDFLTKIMSQK